LLNKITVGETHLFIFKKKSFLFLPFLVPKFPPTQFIGGSVPKSSELQIEVVEFLWKDVEVTIKMMDLPALCPKCTDLS
jgi:hypothetical protein